MQPQQWEVMGGYRNHENGYYQRKTFFFGSDKNANRLKTILVFTCNAFNLFGNALNGIVGIVT